MLRFIMREVICMAAAALIVSCQRTEEVASPEPTVMGESAQQDSAEVDLSQDALEASNPRSEEVRSDLASPLPPPAASEPAQPYAEEGPNEEEPGHAPTAAPRDLAAELEAAVGNLNDCIVDVERAGPTQIQVTIGALVRPSGVIIQPTASGTGLSQNARQCIVRRVDAVTLRALDSDVSQRVSTVIAVEYVPPWSPKSASPLPEPTLRNVREPLPKRPEVAPSGRPIQEPTSRPIQDDKSRPIQDTSSRKVRGPKPRPIDGWEVDESSKEWR